MRERFFDLRSYKVTSRFFELDPDELAFATGRLANPDIVSSGLAAVVEVGWHKQGDAYTRVSRLKVPDESTKDAWITELDTYKQLKKRKE